MLGATVCGCCVDNCCVDGHSVGGCGVGGSCEGRVYVKNVMNGVFWRIDQMLLRTIELCSSGTEYFEAV